LPNKAISAISSTPAKRTPPTCLVLDWLSQGPSRLNAVQGSGDVGYLNEGAASHYGGQIADAAKIALAKQLGLPYAAAYGVGTGPEHQYTTPEDIPSEAEAEQRFGSLRDLWQSEHPDVQLEPWSPQFAGQNVDQLAQDAEVRRALGLSPDAAVTPELLDFYRARVSGGNTPNTL
jgi:hypothetical protein